MEKNNIDILNSIDFSLNEEKEQAINNLFNTTQNNSLEIVNEVLSPIIEEIEESEEQIINNITALSNKFDIANKNEKKPNPILSNLVFFIKYISTSTLIFLFLLVTTNYSAYLNIAKSIIYKDEMKQDYKSIINSVEASKVSNTITKETEDENEKSNSDKYSIKGLVGDASVDDYKLDIEITPFENRIIIPKIGKNIPLVDIRNQSIKGPKELENIFMKELEKGVIRYPGSSKPGEEGNTFIFGHSSNFPWIKGNYNDVFVLLDKLSIGDEIIIYYEQKKYIYTIKGKKVISPGDVSVLKAEKGQNKLSIMTCWPIGTTLNRLIVSGEITTNKNG